MLIGDVVARSAPFGCGFGMSVRLLVTIDPAMCRDPVDGDLIVFSEYSGAGLHRRDSEALAGAVSVRTLSMAAVESTNTVYLCPLSWRWSRMRRAWFVLFLISLFFRAMPKLRAW